MVVTGGAALLLLEFVVVRALSKRWEFVSICASMLNLFYLTVVTSGATLLRGRHLQFHSTADYLLHGAKSASVLEYRVLHADVRVPFSTSSRFYAGAWTACIAMGLGFPVWFVAVFRWLRQQHSVAHARKKLNFLVSDMKDDCWFWEAVVLARKGLSVIFVHSLADFPYIQVQCLSLLYCSYYTLHDVVDPFANPARRLVERMSYIAGFIVCNIVLAMYSEKQHTGRVLLQGELAVAIAVVVQGVALLCIIWVFYGEIKQAFEQQSAGSGGEDRVSHRMIEIARPATDAVVPRVDVTNIDATHHVKLDEHPEKERDSNPLGVAAAESGAVVVDASSLSLDHPMKRAALARAWMSHDDMNSDATHHVELDEHPGK
jgi:hypothetical protein